MALVLRCGAVFLHVPKTGGSWVEKVLYDSDLVAYETGHKHATVERAIYPHTYHEGLKFVFCRAIPKLVGKPTFKDPPFMFCFVRHPISWYESWWKYNMKLGWPNWGDSRELNNWHPNASLNDLGSESFNTFIRNVMEYYPGYVTDLYSSYTGPLVRYMGKQESLAEDLIAVLKLLGLKFSEDRIRKQEKINTSNTSEGLVWDEDVKKKVLQLEYPGLVRYGYI